MQEATHRVFRERVQFVNDELRNSLSTDDRVRSARQQSQSWRCQNQAMTTTRPWCSWRHATPPSNSTLTARPSMKTSQQQRKHQRRLRTYLVVQENRTAGRAASFGGSLGSAIAQASADTYPSRCSSRMEHRVNNRWRVRLHAAFKEPGAPSRKTRRPVPIHPTARLPDARRRLW